MSKQGSIAALALVLAATPVAAQHAPQRFETSSDTPATVEVMRRGHSPLWYAKWGTLILSVGAGAYGFFANNDAEDRYEQLEFLCTADMEVCTQRLPNGEFVDRDLEARYQDVLDLDRRARFALLASQIGAVSSVLLFILDLRDGDTPPNIPYDPNRFSIGSDHAGRVVVRAALPW